MELEFKGIIFDDYETNEEGRQWSRICDECVTSKQIVNIGSYLDDAGSGVCGVKGCCNECDHYIDFEDVTS